MTEPRCFFPDVILMLVLLNILLDFANDRISFGKYSNFQPISKGCVHQLLIFTMILAQFKSAANATYLIHFQYEINLTKVEVVLNLHHKRT